MTKNLIEKLNKVSKILADEQISEELLSNLEKNLDLILEKKKEELSFIPNELNQPIQIWSDGACQGNPGPGGWGTIIEISGQRFELSGASAKTTNNIMELTGALEGIKKTPEGCSILLTSDSQYLVKGMSEWIHGWKKKNWKKADGKPVLNKELWQELDQESAKRTIQWNWIKGHAGHPENERCDELARNAIKQ